MRKSDTPRSAEAIYREAARRIEAEGDVYGWSDYSYSCTAILRVAQESGVDGKLLTKPYVATFAPEKRQHSPETDLQYAFYEDRGCAMDYRVMALCFMAAMVERP